MWMRARRVAVGLALLTASLATPPRARADLDLQWDAPPGCPRRDEVHDRIRALAGSSLDRTRGLSAEGTITRVDGRFYLTLLVRDGPDVRKRVIAADSCATLAGAAAVTLALLLGIEVRAPEPRGQDESGAAPAEESPPADGEQNRERTGEEPRAEGTEPGRRGDQRVEQSPAVSAEVATPAPSASTRPWAILLRGPVVAADVGPLPRATVGVGLRVGMGYGSWRALVAGQLSAGQTVSVPEQGGALGAELQRMTGQLTICRGWRARRFEVAPCVGLAVEHMTARGFGDGVSQRSARAVWPAPSVGAVAHWHAMESLALFAGVSGYLELSRPHLVIDGLGEIAQLGRTAAGGSAGLEWLF